MTRDSAKGVLVGKTGYVASSRVLGLPFGKDAAVLVELSNLPGHRLAVTINSPTPMRRLTRAGRNACKP